MMGRSDPMERSVVLDTYSVEVLNLGKRPIPGIASSTQTFDDPTAAMEALYRAVGDLVFNPGLTVLGTERRDVVGGDGVIAAARLTSEADGGRVEVLLRRRSGGAGPEVPTGLPASAEDRYDDS